MISSGRIFAFAFGVKIFFIYEELILFIVLKILVAKVRNLLGDHYMEDLSPRLKFQPGAGLKFCSDYVENLSPGLKIFSPVFFFILYGGKVFGCLKKMYSMFVIYV